MFGIYEKDVNLMSRDELTGLLEGVGLTFLKSYELIFDWGGLDVLPG